MTKIKSITASLTILMMTAVLAVAQTQNQSQPQNSPALPDGKELLKKVNETNRSLKTFHFEGQTVMEMKGEGIYMRMEMPFVIAAGQAGQKRVQVKGPFEMSKTVVSDGKTVWTYIPAEKKFTKKPFDKSQQPEAGASPLGQFRGDAMLMDMLADDLTEGMKSAKVVREEEIEIDGRRVNSYVIETYYGDDEKAQAVKTGNAEAGKEFSVPMTFWVDKERLIVLRHSFNGGGAFAAIFRVFGDGTDFSMTTTMKVAKVNETLPESLFAFTPPADAREVEKFDSKVAAGLGGGEPERPSLVGKDAVSFTLTDLGGKQFNMEKMRGQVVVIDFWASWCGPCRETMPHVEKLHREFKDKGLIVLGINDEEAAAAKQFVQKHGYTFPTLIDAGSTVSEQYGVMSIPQTLIIDRDGKVFAHFFGTGQEENLREAVKVALETKPESNTKAAKKQVASKR